MTHLYENEEYLDQLAENDAAEDIQRQIHRNKLLNRISAEILKTQDLHARNAMRLMLELMLDGQS